MPKKCEIGQKPVKSPYSSDYLYTDMIGIQGKGPKTSKERDDKKVRHERET